MRILVLSQAYPSSNNKYAMSYVHTRCVSYLRLGCSVDVLSFSVKDSYLYEGVRVLSEGQVELEQYDIVLSHAPNIKNHVRLLSRVSRKKVVFFFHGHEVLRRRDYPTPYTWRKQSLLKQGLISVYDEMKLFFLRLWLHWFSRRNDIGLVFVSDWMRDQFDKNIISSRSFCRSVVICNSVNPHFEESSYAPQNIEADFVTIRPLDESKYCLDLVVSLARANPSLKFHVYGRGEFFQYVEKPDNLSWFDCFIPQSDIPALLNRYRAALMPTRYDAQGVMACEMAVYGIPLVTTEIPICKEMLAGFSNVCFLTFDDFSKALDEDVGRSMSDTTLRSKFSAAVLAQQELSFLDEI